MIDLAIIDYGSGNLRSVAKACERALLDHDIPGKVTVTSDSAQLSGTSHIMLPGVGAFGDCMRGLAAQDGMLDELTEQVMEKQTWFLGICVGMQLLFDRGYEHGEHQGLGWISGEVKRFEPSGTLKVPHMGWNELHTAPPRLRGGQGGSNTVSSGLDMMPPLTSPPQAGGIDSCIHPLLKDIKDGAHAYFVHSYHARNVPKEHIIATTDYGGSVVAAVAKDNVHGTQFHPEKSQATGLTLLANFLRF